MNDKCRQTSVSIDFAMDQRFCNVKEMRSQFLMEIDRHFFLNHGI